MRTRRVTTRASAGGVLALSLAACGAGAPSAAPQRARLDAALKRYGHDHQTFTDGLIQGLSRLDYATAHSATVQMRDATRRFDAVVGSLTPPSAGQPAAQALILASRREADDIAQAAAAPGLRGIVLAVGRWAKDSGPELELAIRLRQDLGKAS